MIHISEEKIIDLVIGNVGTEEKYRLEEHLKTCLRCQEKLYQWQNVIDTERRIQPSRHLQERIWQQVEPRTWNTSVHPVRRRNKPKVAVIFSFVLAAVLLLALGLMNTKPTVKQRMEVAQNDDIVEEELFRFPETKQMAVVPVSDFRHIRGNLWMNDETEEMLLEVDGLVHMQGQDYQLWIIYENNDIQGELLSIQDGGTRVLFKGPEINEFKLIKASVEPKGGSEKQTGPDTFVVPIQQGTNFIGF